MGFFELAEIRATFYPAMIGVLIFFKYMRKCVGIIASVCGVTHPFLLAFSCALVNNRNSAFRPIHNSVLMRKVALVKRYCCVLQILDSSVDLSNEEKLVIPLSIH